MAFIESGEPISLPENYSAFSVVNPPTYRTLNTKEHQNEPVIVRIEDGRGVVFTIRGFQHIGEHDRLYSGTYKWKKEIPNYRDKELGKSFLLITNEGTEAHEAEVWLENPDKREPLTKDEIIKILESRKTKGN
jgi:hypothetical protein